jgi:hypothetical protein
MTWYGQSLEGHTSYETGGRQNVKFPEQSVDKVSMGFGRLTSVEAGFPGMFITQST